MNKRGRKQGRDLGYRKSEEEEEWKRRDKIEIEERRMKEMGIEGDEEFLKIEESVKEEVKEDGERMKEKEEGRNVMSIKDEIWKQE